VACYGVVTLYGVEPAAFECDAEGPGSVTLSWGQASVGFLLQSAATLTRRLALQIRTVCDFQNVATVNAAADTGRFYRLVLP